jgi:CRP/FNR family transcriptional regulator
MRSIGYKYMLGRLADTLLYLGDDRFTEYNIFEFITRKDIADFSCLSKESTIKLITQLNQSKIIKSDRNRIEILLHHDLQKLSNMG